MANLPSFTSHQCWYGKCSLHYLILHGKERQLAYQSSQPTPLSLMTFVPEIYIYIYMYIILQNSHRQKIHQFYLLWLFTLTFKLLKDMLAAPEIIRIDNQKKSPLIQKLQNSFTHNNQKYLLKAFPALTFFKMQRKQ